MDSFRIKQAEFVTSMVRPSDFPADRLPEIAFAGKSNVGKSSLINALANNRKLALISSKPGKTRFVNFFKINGAFYLVDLPGYGFSRVSKAVKESWGKLVEGYLGGSDRLQHLYLLVDIRHAPTNDDRQMCEWLRHYQVPFTVIATKCDKIAKSKWSQYTRRIQKTLELDAGEKIFPVSASARIGCEQITLSIGEAVYGTEAEQSL